MRRRGAGILVATIVLASIFAYAVTVLPDNARAAILYVGGSGPGNYTTIQEAINNSNPGDTVFVYAGTYYEHLTVNKTLSLVGEDRNSAFVNGTRTGTVLNISADWVNVTGFTILEGGYWFDDNQGVQLHYVENCRITNNNVSNGGGHGINLYRSRNNIISDNVGFFNEYNTLNLVESSSNIITGNRFLLNHYGIRLVLSDNNTVKDNFLWENGYGHYGFGISLSRSRDNIVEGNNATYHGEYGFEVHASSGNIFANNTAYRNLRGIEGRGSDGNSFINNEAIHNSQSGIIISGSHNLLAGNDFSNNSNGVTLGNSTHNAIYDNTFFSNINHGIRTYDGSNNNTIFRNVFSKNGDGINLEASHDNQIHHNNFFENWPQAIDNGLNSWDDGYPSGGNYWSNYVGNDDKRGPDQDQPGGDGIGDSPFIIDSDSQDNYPLMYPFGTVHPMPPSMTGAKLSGSNHENVTISWTLSPDDGIGLDSIVNYQVLRNSTYDAHGLGYGLVSSLPKGTSEFVDVGVGEGDPSNYFYLVCAVDIDGNSSCAIDQASKFIRGLSEGLTLVSIPLLQFNESIEVVFQTLRFDKAWTYHAWDGNNTWKSYTKFKPHKGDLKVIDHKMGIWVNVTQDCNLTVAGVVPLVTKIGLWYGWNLVGFPSFNTLYTVGDLKSETGALRVEGFDPSAPPDFLRLLGDGDLLEAGNGYWVLVETPVTWFVTNP